MADIERGFTFTDGGSGTASELHQLVDSATILPAFIGSKSTAAPASGDKFVFYKTDTQTLRAVTLANLIAAFPQGGAAGNFALRKLGTAAGMAAPGNDARFPARVTGVRLGNNNQPDTAAATQDLCFAAVNLNGATQIDWSAGDLFYDTLTGNKTYTFAHVPSTLGQVITVALKLNGHTVTWPSLLGTPPAINASATVHYFTFIRTPLGTSGTVIAL